MGNLASLLRAQNALVEARKLEERVLACTQKALGEAHPDTLTAKNNLAVTLGRLDDVARARQLQEEVLATRRKVLGKEHPNTLGAARNLHRTLDVQGDTAAAAELLQEFNVPWLLDEVLTTVFRRHDAAARGQTPEPQREELEQPGITLPYPQSPADYYGAPASGQPAAYTVVLCHRARDTTTAQQIAEELQHDG